MWRNQTGDPDPIVAVHDRGFGATISDEQFL